MTKHIYSLNAFELQMLVLAAERRNCGKQPNGVQNQKVDKKLSDFSVNLHGVVGEYAVSKMLGLKLDTNVNLSGDDKVSDLTYNGRTIQVKTAVGNLENPRLYFRDVDNFQAEVAVLASAWSFTEVAIHGWVTREQFKAKQRPWTTTYGTVPALDAADLESPYYLKPYLETL